MACPIEKDYTTIRGVVCHLQFAELWVSNKVTWSVCGIAGILLLLVVQVEQDILALIDEWQQQTGETFFVYGQSFEEFVKKRHNEYVADKENEKILRVGIDILAYSILYNNCNIVPMQLCDVVYLMNTATNKPTFTAVCIYVWLNLSGIKVFDSSIALHSNMLFYLLIFVVLSHSFMPLWALTLLCNGQ